MFVADVHDLLYISLKKVFKQTLPTVFPADVPIFLLKSQFLCIWIDGIPGKELGDQETYGMLFLRGLGRVLWLNQLGHLKSFPWLEITMHFSCTSWQCPAIASCTLLFQKGSWKASRITSPDLNIQNSPNSYLYVSHIYKQNSNHMKVN